ncbi:hypothetical protein [Clostridium sp. C8-1-8]|nr:hypothetical protein [Clostridium sp. C8-1-8]
MIKFLGRIFNANNFKEAMLESLLGRAEITKEDFASTSKLIKNIKTNNLD